MLEVLELVLCSLKPPLLLYNERARHLQLLFTAASTGGWWLKRVLNVYERFLALVRRSTTRSKSLIIRDRDQFPNGSRAKRNGLFQYNMMIISHLI